MVAVPQNLIAGLVQANQHQAAHLQPDIKGPMMIVWIAARIKRVHQATTVQALVKNLRPAAMEVLPAGLLQVTRAEAKVQAADRMNQILMMVHKAKGRVATAIRHRIAQAAMAEKVVLQITRAEEVKAIGMMMIVMKATVHRADQVIIRAITNILITVAIIIRAAAAVLQTIVGTINIPITRMAHRIAAMVLITAVAIINILITITIIAILQTAGTISTLIIQMAQMAAMALITVVVIINIPITIAITAVLQTAVTINTLIIQMVQVAAMVLIIAVAIINILITIAIGVAMIRVLKIHRVATGLTIARATTNTLIIIAIVDTRRAARATLQITVGTINTPITIVMVIIHRAAKEALTTAGAIINTAILTMEAAGAAMANTMSLMINTMANTVMAVTAKAAIAQGANAMMTGAITVAEDQAPATKVHILKMKAVGMKMIRKIPAIMANAMSMMKKVVKGITKTNLQTQIAAAGIIHLKAI